MRRHGGRGGGVNEKAWSPLGVGSVRGWSLGGGVVRMRGANERQGPLR